MRPLLLVFAAVIISFLCMHSQGSEPHVFPRWNRIAFPITPDTVIVPEPAMEKFSGDIVEMFHVIFPPEAGRVYTEPDKSNTRVFYLDRLASDDEQTILIETWAGAPGGSCGNSIKAGTYYRDEMRWESMVDACGAVDTVYSIAHNYRCDFAVTDKWGGSKVRFQYDGKTYVGVSEPTPISDTELIAVLVHRELKEYDYTYVRDYIMPEVQWNYVHLDSSGNPFLFIGCGMDGTFILHEDRPHEFSLVNFLEDDVNVNILLTRHNGMPDIHTFDIGYVYCTYHWDGKKYVLHHTDEWVCPH